jgi:AcrR family transcriptional regulator
MAMNSRQRLLEAAITAIENGGEAALRVDEVAAAAEITKPSLYHHFGDRDGLVAAAQAERFRRLMMLGTDQALDVVRSVSSVDEFVATFPGLVGIGAGEAGARRRAARAAVLGSATSRPELTREIRKVMVLAAEQLAEFFRIGKERGLIGGDFDADAMAVWWLAVLAGRHLVDVVDDERITTQWEQMTLRSIEAVVLGD